MSLVLARPTYFLLDKIYIYVSGDSRYNEHTLMYVCVVESRNVSVIQFLVQCSLSVQVSV